MTTYAYPAIALCVWSLLCFVYLRLARKHSTIPLPVDVHPMSCFLNMKADILSQRPGVLALGLSLLAAVVPVANLLFCAFVLMATVQAVRLRNGWVRPELPAAFADIDD